MYKPFTYLVVTYFPTYLPTYLYNMRLISVQNWLPRWNQRLTQLRFIHDWVITGIQWMVHSSILPMNSFPTPFIIQFQFNSFHLSSEASSRLDFLSGGPPLFPYLICFLVTTGGGFGNLMEFGNLMFPLWFALLGGFFRLFWTWVLPFCSLYSPFFGCFRLYLIGWDLSFKS